MLEVIQENLESYQKTIANCAWAINNVGHLQLENTEVNPYGCSIWFSTPSRSDVEKLMTIIPPGQFWKKETVGSYVQYSYWDEANQRSICINASDDALPPTCTLEEVEVVVPAREAYTEKRKIVKCKEPVKQDDIPMEVETPMADTPPYSAEEVETK